MTVGEKIRAIRVLSHVSQKKLALMCGLSENAIVRYETNQRIPKQEHLQRIADVLNVNILVFYDIDWHKLKVETVGDLMKLYFLLSEYVGVSVDFQKDDNGQVDPKSVNLHLENDRFNQLIVQYEEERKKKAEELETINTDFIERKILPETNDTDVLRMLAVMEMMKVPYLEYEEKLEK